MIFDWEEAMEGYFRLYLGDDKVFNTHLRRTYGGYAFTIIDKTGLELFEILIDLLEDGEAKWMEAQGLELFDIIEKMTFTDDNIKRIIEGIFE